VITQIAPSGLHDFVGTLLAKHPRRSGKALDLGTGHGAMAERLQGMGYEVLAADQSTQGFEANIPVVEINFDQPDFAGRLGLHSFDVVTAVEVIEHVESPIGFLRNIRRLLSPPGFAVITTPNVDSLAARLKHLLYGRIRGMDELGEPTHISPIFIELFQRQFLRLANLKLEEHLVFPPRGFQLSRLWVAWLMGMTVRLLPGNSIAGDHHVFVLSSSEQIKWTFGG